MLSLNFLAARERVRDLHKAAEASRIDADASPVTRVTLRYASAADAGSLRHLGVLAGTEAAAEPAAAALEARLSALKRTYSGLSTEGHRPTVLLQVWNRPIYTIGGRHLMSDALELCGARNIFADLPEPAPLVATEAVIGRNPDIILAAAPPGEGAAWVADWQRLPGLAAVRNHRVVAFENQALSRLGPSVLDATEDLCRTLARVSRGSL